MIENATVAGRPAIVSYLSDTFQPVDKDEAVLIKIKFTDEQGGMAFAKVKTGAAPQPG